MSLEMDKEQTYKAFLSAIPCFVLSGLYFVILAQVADSHTSV